MSPSPLKRKTRLCLLLVLSLLSVTTGARAEQLPIKSYTSADGLAGEYIDCIVHDSHGFLWFCTPEGLSRFGGYNFVNYGLEQGLPTGEALNLLERRDGSYWVGTTNGVCHFNLFAAQDEAGTTGQRSNTAAFGILASAAGAIAAGGSHLYAATPTFARVFELE